MDCLTFKNAVDYLPLQVHFQVMMTGKMDLVAILTRGLLDREQMSKVHLWNRMPSKAGLGILPGSSYL